eukprot:1144364-Amphidinium_carterae.1
MFVFYTSFPGQTSRSHFGSRRSLPGVWWQARDLPGTKGCLFALRLVSSTQKVTTCPRGENGLPAAACVLPRLGQAWSPVASHEQHGMFCSVPLFASLRSHATEQGVTCSRQTPK